MGFYLRALSYFKKDTALIVASLVCIGLSTLAGLLQPFLFAIPVDMIFSDNPSAHWVHRAFASVAPATIPGQVITLAVLALVLRIVQEFLDKGQKLLGAHVAYNGSVRVRCDLFRKLQELSLHYHKSQPQGDAIYRLSYDTGGFHTILTVLVNTVLVSAVTLVVMTWIMLTMDWKLTLIALAVGPILMVVTRLFSQSLKQRWMEMKDADTRLTTSIQRSLSSIGLVQAFGREQDEYNRFRETVGLSTRTALRQQRQELLYWLIVGLIFGIGSSLILGYGGYLVYRDQHVLKLAQGGMTVGQLLVFLAYLNQVYGPLQAISGSGVNIQGGVVGARRVFDVLDRDPIIQDSPGAVHLPRQPRVLEMEKVSFEYRPGEPVLQEINVTIRPGQMVAFVGSSGVGKTTLLNLLPRFYDPTQGSLKLDGHDLRSIKIKDLRKHVALVLQESVILPTTIAENIAYGRTDATESQIRKAAELAGAASFVERLPEKYNAEVAESGQNLSGGQRQRIAIARALLTEAPIMVLDEPTSALDPQHEQMITETLRSLKRQRTIILVSHRLSTVADCDQIFVMDEGRIVEQGTHEELVGRHGLYYSMAKHQMKLKDQPELAASSESV